MEAVEVWLEVVEAGLGALEADCAEVDLDLDEAADTDAIVM